MSSNPHNIGSHSRPRDRPAIAACACQNCHRRKTKCDQGFPKCSFCKRMDLQCQYPESQPVKKDQMTKAILRVLARIEDKMDKYTICRDSPLASGSLAPISETGASPIMLSAAATATRATSSTVTVSDGQCPVAEGVAHASAPRQPLTIPHHVITWPNVSAHLATGGGAMASLVSDVLEQGPAWFLRHELAKHSKPLPSGVGLPYIPFNPRAVDLRRSPAVTFPFLSIQRMMSYSETYFNTFDNLDPILDREHFKHGIMARLLREGYVEDDPSAVLALLVFALAEVAIAGINAQPLGESETYPSRFQSGTAEQPPGLALFNEARRRLAFIRTDGSLEHVQILLLQATYYEASARHLDYWSSATAASMACQLVIRSSNVDWTSAYGDSVSRAFWSCLIKEDLFRLDLDLPRTGIADLHERVPCPHFRSAEMGKDSNPRNSHHSFDGKQKKHHASFLALIELKSLISSIGTVFEEAHAAPHTPSECPIPSVAVVREILSRLDQWRALLPSSLQWKDSDGFDFAEPATQHGSHCSHLLDVHQCPTPVTAACTTDILTAQLRTRFYHARYLIRRGFVYKALHFPSLMTSEDQFHCGAAIKSACFWPLSMTPHPERKRLVPHLFVWTHSFFNILLVLRMCSANDCLRQIMAKHEMLESDIRSTITLLLNWMQDVSWIGGVADWSLEMLDMLFAE